MLEEKIIRPKDPHKSLAEYARDAAQKSAEKENMAWRNHIKLCDRIYRLEKRHIENVDRTMFIFVYNIAIFIMWFLR